MMPLKKGLSPSEEPMATVAFLPASCSAVGRSQLQHWGLNEMAGKTQLHTIA
jgi:hypothetical protein